MPPTNDPSFPLFRTFLSTHVAETHPTAADVIGVWLTPNRKLNQSKEIAYQQQRFMEFSKEYLATEPWLSLIACRKHRQIESHYDLSAARFSDLADKRFWDTLTADVGQQEARALSLVDNETLVDVDSLLRYQRQAECIASASGAVARVGAIQAQLPALRLKLSRTKALSLEAYSMFIFLGVGFLVLAIAIPSIKEIRTAQPLFIILSLVSAAAGIGIGGSGITKALAKQRLSSQCLELDRELNDLFENTVTPCLHLAGADVAVCRNDLHKTEKFIEYVVKYFDYLNKKLLGSVQ